MNRDETIQVLKTVKGYFPSSFRRMTKEEAYQMIEVWSNEFRNVPVDRMNEAIHVIVKNNSTKGFAPSVSQVIEALDNTFLADSNYVFGKLTLRDCYDRLYALRLRIGLESRN